MKKKIILMLCVCMCILGLAACGTDPKTMDYNGKSYQELEDYANQTWNGIQAWDEATMEATITQIESMSETARRELMSAYEGMEDSYQLMKSWAGIYPELGSFVGVGSFEIEKSGKSTTTELILNFDKRSAVLSCVYKNLTMEVETITVDLVYSTGEKMQKALLNTAMGMGTVFVMLIIISLLISCFRIIPMLEAKLKRKNEPVPRQEEMPAAVAVPAAKTDDLELIAVITAAIAAGTGQSADDFVVRSIKRR